MEVIKSNLGVHFPSVMLFGTPRDGQPNQLMPLKNVVVDT